MKVIIQISKRGSAIRTARQQIQESNVGKSVDFKLFFESAKSLFTELTPSRLDLLNTLSKIGLCSINELATSAQKNHSSIESDVIRLEELGLIERTEDGKISVPFESIEIFMPLAA
jgi:predicted transcriptional regulator